MATDIPMNTLLQVLYDDNDLNGLNVDGCEWRKPYTVTIPSKPTGVASITVTRSDSESNCDQLSTTSLTSTGTVLYGDTVSVSATASTGYNNPTVSFKSGVTNNKVTGDVTLNVSGGSGKTYYVYYKQGLASSATNLPGTQSRTYPNATTLASNSMSKTATTSSGYSITYAAGLSTSGTLPSTTTATDTTSYTANGWTTGSTNTNDPDYANGASFGSSSTTNLTLYPNFTTSLSRGSVTVGTNNMSKSNTTANSYTVTYANGTATSGTLPSAQTSVNTTTYTKNGWTTSSTATNDRDYTNGQTISNFSSNLTLYPNFTTSTTNGGVTLGTNSMAKSNTTANSYTVSYAQGNASSTTNLPSTQTSINTTVYTKNGWTKTSGSTTQNYANGAATGALSANLTLYPCFSQTTTNGGVTTSNNTMSRNNGTASGYSVTYAQGTASSTTNLPSKQTATDTIAYTHAGWATSASGSKAYNKNAATGALSSSITLYPYFTSAVSSRGSVTLSTNSMSKSETSNGSYTVTYNYNGGSGSPASATASKVIRYSANGWTTTSGSTTRTHTNGQSVQMTSALTLYPCFSQSNYTYAVTLPTPTRTNYDFKGWATSSSASSGITGSYTPTGDVTLYAVWEIKKYSVSYPAMPATVASFKIYKNGTAVITNPNSAGSFKADYNDTIGAEATGATGYQASAVVDGKYSTLFWPVTVTKDLTVTLDISTASYSISYPAKPTGVLTFNIYKNGSIVISNPTSASNFTAYHNDKIYATATASTYYGSPTITGVSTSSSSPTTVTGSITITLKAGSYSPPVYCDGCGEEGYHYCYNCGEYHYASEDCQTSGGGSSGGWDGSLYCPNCGNTWTETDAMYNPGIYDGICPCCG